MRRVLLIGLVVFLAGCGSSERTIDPDLLFGHRHADRTEDGRWTLTPAPPVGDEQVFTYPAIVDNVQMRVSDPDSLGFRRMDILFYGSLPDDCSRLNSIAEEYIGHMITLTFEMIRPKGESCRQVVRRFRFYHELSRPLEAGAYNLMINDVSHPFQLRDPFEDETP